MRKDDLKMSCFSLGVRCLSSSKRGLAGGRFTFPTTQCILLPGSEEHHHQPSAKVDHKGQAGQMASNRTKPSFGFREGPGCSGLCFHELEGDLAAWTTAALPISHAGLLHPPFPTSACVGSEADSQVSPTATPQSPYFSSSHFQQPSHPQVE